MADLRPPAEETLKAFDHRFRQALTRGSAGDLRVLGYGELSTTVLLETGNRRLAVKRLPPFDSRQRHDCYQALFAEYITRLEAAGVVTVPSVLCSLAAESPEVGTITYCVQPALESADLGPCWLSTASPPASRRAAECVIETILATVGPEVGFDAQLSNWARPDGIWSYLDLTTPLLRTPDGEDRLDTGLFLAMLPRLLRPFVRWFFLRDILRTYFDPRGVVVDLLANLLKERLAYHLSVWTEVANQQLPGDPVSPAEIRRYYRSDARLWALLLAVRRADRWVTRYGFRRPYPFLLPGPITR